ncbi:MAG: hypothetical protein WC879_15395 [Melioribacteraceae bacterium]
MTFKKKYGIVILLDALGVSGYNENQIKEFLSARQEINEIVKSLTITDTLKEIGYIGKFYPPIIFSFGDTVVVTIELKSKKFIKDHIWIVSLLMKRYLFHSLEKRILFRGSFSIGNYIADSDSNTIMGEALNDAASWYEASDWMGIFSTPKTNSLLEYLYCDYKKVNNMKHFHDNGITYLHSYSVPLKLGGNMNSYVINWPSAFFDKTLLSIEGKENPEKYFLEIMSSFTIPKGSESKYENIKKYFYYIAEKRLKDSQENNK